MATESITDLTPVTPPKTASKSRRRTIGVFIVLALAVGALLSQGILGNLNYFKTVDEVMKQRTSIGTEVIRLEGVVKPHTIVRTATGASFWVTGSGSNEIFVQSHGTPPQLFQANIPVVVVGHFASLKARIFDGTEIMVKHTASYIAAHPGRVKAPNGTTR